MSDKRFNIRVVLDIEEVKGEGVHKFYKEVLEWSDVPHHGLVFMEQIMSNLIGTKMMELGVVSMDGGKEAAKKFMQKHSK